MTDMKGFEIQTYQSVKLKINSVFDDRDLSFSKRKGWMKVAAKKRIVLSKKSLSNPFKKPRWERSSGQQGIV
jgi:uncharacterized ubiquitin-like protein YukD